MNKLLLFCLFSAALVALSYGEEANGEDTELASEHEVIRMSREADPKRRNERKNKGKRGKSGLKKRKQRKSQKSQKSKKSHKSQKSKKSKKSRKSKKSKKSKKTKGVNNRRKKTRFAKKLRATCAGTSDTCVDNGITYMKLLKDRVKNFKAQSNRITGAKTKSGKKADKKGIFEKLKNIIREAGGGNSSNPTCNGATGSGADQLKNLTTELGLCEASINKSCNADLPKPNMTKIDNCTADIEAFEKLTIAAINASGAAACVLWEATALKDAAAKIQGTACDISSDNKAMVKANKDCVTAFGKCRRIEDTVSEAVSACSPANSAANVKAKIANGIANKAAAKVLSDKVTALTAARNIRATITCTAFGIDVVELAGKCKKSPLAPQLTADIKAVSDSTVSACTATEKAALKTAGETFSEAEGEIDAAIEAEQKNLEISTGSTISTSGVTGTTSSMGLTTKKTGNMVRLEGMRKQL